MKFHERFNIKIDQEEARRRFVNRIYNDIFVHYNPSYHVYKVIASALGKKYDHRMAIGVYLSDDFYENLEALESVYEFFRSRGQSLEIESRIHLILEKSEVDLGITWRDGKFIPTGAKLLDEKLVNENLNWLTDKKYSPVLDPFEKGLSHYLHSIKRPELLPDVITDMYESLEALAKIISGREDKDLSANRDLFIRKINISEEYKMILKQYIDYANKFRHAAKRGVDKPKLNRNEVESFIYLTGIFIRLAAQVEM